MDFCSSIAVIKAIEALKYRGADIPENVWVSWEVRLILYSSSNRIEICYFTAGSAVIIYTDEQRNGAKRSALGFYCNLFEAK